MQFTLWSSIWMIWATFIFDGAKNAYESHKIWKRAQKGILRLAGS